MAETPAQGVRARARAQMIEEIKRIAREHLAVDGPNLSLRAVARDLGVVSSAVYRYFASRDDLLTALIIDAYNDLGDAAERAEAAVPRRDLAGRWSALCHAIRNWALANQPEYALLYGSPVPGYHAPEDTIGPASRPVWVFATIVSDAAGRGALDLGTERLGKGLRADMELLAQNPGFEGVPPVAISRSLTVWSQIFGALSFELFGRLTNAVYDYDAFFDHQVKVMGNYVGLSS